MSTKGKNKNQSELLKKMCQFNITERFMKQTYIFDSHFLELVKLSKTKNELKKYIISRYSSNNNDSLKTIVGAILGKYDITNINVCISEKCDFQRNNELDQETIRILRSHFIEYLNSHINLKNAFLMDKRNFTDYTVDLDEEKVLGIFDQVIDGDYSDSNSSIIKEYIVNVLGIYGKNRIASEMDFILYDLIDDSSLTLEEREKEFYRYKGLSSEERKKIKNANELLNNLREIKTVDTNDVVKRLEALIASGKLEEKIGELSDIYLEYEFLIRRDLINNLYIPQHDVEIIEDFNKTGNLLVHLFLRDPEKFREIIIAETKLDIISKSNDKNAMRELTNEEQQDLERRLKSIDAELDPSQVNYTYDLKSKYYTDRENAHKYHSDTTNQIATSLYPTNYFIDNCISNLIGVGFDASTLSEEAIAVQSAKYITSNKGLNNLEYDESKPFEYESAPFSRLLSKENNKSEILLFRRGMDYDLKASYVFVTIDSSNPNMNLLQMAQEYAIKNHLKLLIYDVYKIRKTYLESLINFDRFGKYFYSSSGKKL